MSTPTENRGIRTTPLAKPEPAQDPTLTDATPRRPEWDAVRDTVAQITFAGRLYLRGQVKLGMLLSELKKSHCKHGGNRKDQVADSATWSQIVTAETGFSRKSGDEFIRLFEASKAKLKKSKTLQLPAAAKDAIVLFQSESALALTEEQWVQVDALIGSLTTGETQATLMQELHLIAKPKAMPKGKTPDGDEKTDEETAGQLAFHFFEAMASPLINARTNPDYKKLLYAMPLYSDSEHPLSLATLEAEFRAALADIEDAKQAAAKPAKGKVIEA